MKLKTKKAKDVASKSQEITFFFRNRLNQKIQ